LTLLIVASLAGVFFGLYYKFLVLVPITLAAAIASSAAALWAGLQGGYMIGLTSRDFLGQILARNDGVQSKRI
jgi:hypothetical protein